MTKVDCEDCYEKFTSKKLYINHVKSKSCSKTKVKSRQRAGHPQQETVGQGAKRVRLEGDPLALVGGTGVPSGLGEAGHFASPSRVAELQGQIKNLSEEQKRALQEQITRKQRQVLQAIPFNQLSAKQKEILAKLCKDTASSTVTTQGSDATNPTRYVTLKAGQVLTPEALQPVKPSIQIMRKVVAQPVQVIQITADDNFSEENIAAEIEVKAPSPVRTGPLRVKAFAKSLLKFANVIKAAEASVSAGPRATVKESCPICKKIFSKSGLEGHIEAKHWISCSKCDKRFPVEQLEVHMKRDHELPRVPCAVCGKVVFSQVLAQHMDIFHSTECGICNMKIVNAELKRHMRETHETAPCSHCCEKFTTKEEVDHHIRNEHLVAACVECELRFLTKELLVEHQNESHPSIFCTEEDCEQVFGTEQKLKEHKDKKHCNPNKFLTFGGGMFMMMMVVDETKAGEDLSGRDPLDELEEEELEGRDDNVEIVGGIVGDIVDRVFSALEGLKHEMCRSLLEELLEAGTMKAAFVDHRSEEDHELCVFDEDVVMDDEERQQ